MGDSGYRFAQVSTATYVRSGANQALLRWEAARDWKELNPNGSKSEFEDYWEELQRDRKKYQVSLVLSSMNRAYDLYLDV